jgi:hypothetical protein
MYVHTILSQGGARGRLTPLHSALVLRVLVEIMGSQKHRTVAESQPVLVIIDPSISTTHPGPMTSGGEVSAWRQGTSCSQNGYLSSRGGCQKRWHSLVNCDHGDSTTSRLDSPPRRTRRLCTWGSPPWRARRRRGRPGPTGSGARSPPHRAPPGRPPGRGGR